ncbi:cupin domain-containing protein [Nocardia aurantia]|uniref:Oxalate decarboxylase OxdD n=1 Tax=Nocardia aurantia TaxID=2585199 RepID=A0A7K0DJR1_9NOCA|nr:cupin domain-containing protein [Nocardia aurantia]MQY26046.1 Oxalate decarboxylase OxdD [Nocardia aurantia]
MTENSSYLFRFAEAAPNEFDVGTLKGAHERNFPVLRDQEGSVYRIRLEGGGIREPHWHPTAWELNYVIAGRARWTVLGTHPDGDYRNETFEAGPDDLVFAPQGFFHYFENVSDTDPLEVLVVFNTSTQEPNDDIGIVGTVNSLPRHVLAASFGVPVSTFDNLPTEVKPVIISRRPPA